MLTIDDINNLACLARIELSDGEKVTLQKDMESILEYVGQLSKVNLTPGPSPKPHPLTPSPKEMGAHPPLWKAGGEALVNVMREDEVTTTTGEYTESALTNAPKREGDFFSVKAIFEDRQ